MQRVGAGAERGSSEELDGADPPFPEVHDAAAPAGLWTYEYLGLGEPGGAPALLAGGVSRRDFLDAVAIGADLSCRLALGLTESVEKRGFYFIPMLSAYVAAAAAALLLRLSGLDADAENAVRVIGFFDRLITGRAGLDALVRSTAELAGCRVVPIPGPSAALAAGAGLRGVERHAGWRGGPFTSSSEVHVTGYAHLG